MRHAPKDPLYPTRVQMIPRDTGHVNSKLLLPAGQTHQSYRLDNQSPCAQETPNDKASKDGLDLWNTALLGIDSVKVRKKACYGRKKDLFLMSASPPTEQAWTYREDDKKNEIDNPSTSRRSHPHSSAPRPPVHALAEICHPSAPHPHSTLRSREQPTIQAPTAKVLIEIELSPSRDI